MTTISLNKSISFDNVIRSLSIAASIFGAVWFVSGRVTTLEATTAENKEQIAAIRAQVASTRDLINSTNTLVVVTTNRLDSFSEAIKEIRVDLSKVNDRVNLLAKSVSYGKEPKAR